MKNLGFVLIVIFLFGIGAYAVIHQNTRIREGRRHHLNDEQYYLATDVLKLSPKEIAEIESGDTSSLDTHRISPHDRQLLLARNLPPKQPKTASDHDEGKIDPVDSQSRTEDEKREIARIASAFLIAYSKDDYGHATQYLTSAASMNYTGTGVFSRSDFATAKNFTADPVRFIYTDGITINSPTSATYRYHTDRNFTGPGWKTWLHLKFLLIKDSGSWKIDSCELDQ